MPDMEMIEAGDVTQQDLDRMLDLAERMGAAAPVRVLLFNLAHALENGETIIAGTATAALTPTQAAKVLGVSRAHLYKVLDMGALPSHRVGRDRRIKLTDLRDYMERSAALNARIAAHDAHADEADFALLDDMD